MKKEEYSEFLKHPLWQKKREEIFNLFGKQCQNCGTQKNLQIHHKTYSSQKMPWEYPTENFQVLCEKCHSITHGFKYEENKCKECGKTISKNFSYCLGCHNSLVAKKENERSGLETKIKKLEVALNKERNIKRPVNQPSTNNHSIHESVSKRLMSEKKVLERKIKELQAKLSNNNKSVDTSRYEKKIIDDLKNKLNETKAKMNQRLLEEKSIRNQKSTEIEKLLSERSVLEKERSEIVEAINELKNLNSRNFDQKSTENDTDKGSVINQINHLRKIMFILIFIVVLSFLATLIFLNKDFWKKTDIETPIETLSNDKKTEKSSISIDSLNSNIGEIVTIEAVVTQVVMAQNGNLYLNVGGNFPNQKLTLVAFPENVFLIPEPEKYEGEEIIVKGELALYNDKPQIVIDKPEQIIKK
jgi:DNA repair exonuclease SbcCD ATPase subunit